MASALFARRTQIQRELADLDEQLGSALVAFTTPRAPDQALTLLEAARMLVERRGRFAVDLSTERLDSRDLAL